MHPRKAKCRDCGLRTADLYWTGPFGDRIELPRCPRCYEEVCRRIMRNERDGSRFSARDGEVLAYVRDSI